MHAYCFANGVIEFGGFVPGGALPIAKGNDKPLRDFVGAVARHAYDGETLLVPGVPEAEDQMAALDALTKWLDWISTGKRPEGVETMGPQARARRRRPKR